MNSSRNFRRETLWDVSRSGFADALEFEIRGLDRFREGSPRAVPQLAQPRNPSASEANYQELRCKLLANWPTKQVARRSPPSSFPC